MILKNGYIFQAIGLNQPSRGANIKDRRPKMDIDDDVENKENTKTDTMRQYNADEILGEQFAGLDKQGLTIYIGNYVHANCLMKHLLSEKNVGWKKQFYQITNIDPITGEETPDWPLRFDLKYVKGLKRWFEGHTELGGLRRFMMEYYNKLISDKDFRIIEFDGQYKRRSGINWVIKITLDEVQERVETWYNAMNVTSLDPAISTKKKSSDGCITTTAFCSDGQRRVIDCSLSKFDIRDRYYNEEDELRIKSTTKLAISIEDLGLIRRRGGVEEAVRHVIRYHSEGLVIENAGQQLAWYEDIRDLLKKVGLRLKLLPFHPTDDKEYKLQVGLLNWFSAARYELLSSMRFIKKVREQVETFPDSKLDILDALHNAEVLGRCPDKIGFSIHGDLRMKKGKRTVLDDIDEAEDVEAYMVLP
jgi:hypothetical protein